MMNRVYPPVRGASGRLLRDIARAYARDGWQVTVITSGPRAIKERDGAVRVIRVKGADRPSSAFGYLMVWLKMLFVALSLPKTELLVTMTDPPLFAIAGDIIKRVKKTKHIHWVQDIYPDLFPIVGVKFPGFMINAMRRSVVRAMSRSDKVFVIGRCMARRLAYSGMPTKKMAVIPNWPDVELGYETHIDDLGDAQDIEDRIASSGRAENYRTYDEQLKTGLKFRVLYAGNIGKIHPIDTVLDAARILQNQNPEIEFLFVGDGPKYDEITRAKAQEHLDNVKLLPYQPPARLKALMESGDVHLITMDERAAGFAVPSKLYSALAAQRPCIYVGPHVSEVAKVIQDYDIGRVIPQGKAEALADAIREYRMDGDTWFLAHENAKKAGSVFIPSASIAAFIDRAWVLVGGRPEKETYSDVDELPEAAE